MWPGTSYDPTIPTQESVLGFAPGKRISSIEHMQRYMRSLADAAPERVVLREYARSWEGRSLIYLVIGSADNIAQLDEYDAGIKALGDPRVTNQAAAESLIATLPSSVWLSYGVHGNEISSMDAAMMTAYHLLAAKNDPVVDKILDNTLVFLDPAQNPDGRARYEQNYYATVGLEDSDDGLSAEHNEPWPTGRENHYLFDMNRDWIAITQPETAGRVKLYQKHRPLVFIDLHEMMSSNSSYYFAPSAVPYNPWLTDKQRANLERVGRNHGKWFDRFGFDYFTRDLYDSFYPGYGDNWPAFQGALSSTYEVAPARGERFLRPDGKVIRFRDSVRRHFVASVSTAEAVADNRKHFLTHYYEYRKSAIAMGRESSSHRSILFSGAEDDAAARRLAGLLAQHEVEITRSRDGFKACGKSYPGGSYVVNNAQPLNRLVHTLMDKQVDMDADFLVQEERRRSRQSGSQIFDVSGWSLPQMFNVPTDVCNRAVNVAGTEVAPTTHDAGTLVPAEGETVAYLVAWGDMHAVRFLTAALRAGIVVKSADEAFTLDGSTRYPAGSLIIETAANLAAVGATLGQIAEASGATVRGVSTSWVTNGPSFGSIKTKLLFAPDIAMLWRQPTSAQSAGNSRFVIERQYGYPVTAIQSDQIPGANLSRYEVIILPSADDYQQVLGDKGLATLKHWVDQGGVLISFGTATRWVADPRVDLIGLRRENAVKESDAKSKPTENKEKESTVNGILIENSDALQAAIQVPSKAPDSLTGVLVNIAVDQEHWLTAGARADGVALALGSDIYRPLTLDRGRNVASFKSADELLASGYLWEENRQQLAHKPFLAIEERGLGMVIAFTQEPTFRAYLDGLNLLLANAFFRAPAHSGKVR
jgi:hypothetical protein